MKDTAVVAMLFEYSDDNYDHLYDDDINEKEKQIESTDSKKRLKVRCHQGNLIKGGPVEPMYEGVTIVEANEAQSYLIGCNKFRDGSRWERLQSGKGS